MHPASCSLPTCSPLNVAALQPGMTVDLDSRTEMLRGPALSLHRRWLCPLGSRLRSRPGRFRVLPADCSALDAVAPACPQLTRAAYPRLCSCFAAKQCPPDVVSLPWEKEIRPAATAGQAPPAGLTTPAALTLAFGPMRLFPPGMKTARPSWPPRTLSCGEAPPSLGGSRGNPLCSAPGRQAHQTQSRLLEPACRPLSAPWALSRARVC